MPLTVLGPLGSDRLVPLPLFLSRVPAGFPSPADETVEAVVDLNEVCGVDGVSTSLVRVDPEGTPMVGADIGPGDVLVVDRSLDAEDGDVVIAAVCGEPTVKTVRVEWGRGRRARRVWLEPQPGEPDADEFPTIEVTAEMGHEVWGVVRWILHRAERRPRAARSAGPDETRERQRHRIGVFRIRRVAAALRRPPASPAEPVPRLCGTGERASTCRERRRRRCAGSALWGGSAARPGQARSAAGENPLPVGAAGLILGASAVYLVHR